MNDNSYFSEREQGTMPRNREEITRGFWYGFVSYIESRISDGSFAEEFPVNCQIHNYPLGTDKEGIGSRLWGEIEHCSWPLDPNDVPDTITAMDVVEFFYRHISKVTDQESAEYKFQKHRHFLQFDRPEGQIDYRGEINLLFRRNGMAYELDEDGKVCRFLNPVLNTLLTQERFQTGDDDLDQLLESAVDKFIDPDINVRKESLEKLWDAFERIKTLESGSYKPQQIQALLEKAIPDPEFRAGVEKEMSNITEIGNQFRIRHSETNRHPINESEYIDYLFHRLFSLIWLFLRRTGRIRT
jgi:hypothetical protein